MQTITTCEPPQQLWIDYPDAPERIDALLAAGQVTAGEAQLLLQFREQGFVIFPQAIPEATVDALRNELLNIHLEKEKYLVRVLRHKRKIMEVISPKHEVLPPMSRLLDLYVNSELARNIALASCTTRFLSLIYREPPLLFQSLLFTWGTEHSIHVDNTYIVSDPPCTLIASWTALEDVDPGCGELAYFPGSHRDPLVVFGSNEIAWVPARDGKQLHNDYTAFLEQRVKDNGKEPEFFYARKGDVMIWHSNLVHYGTQRKLAGRTRYSLLAHYCPAESAIPNYFKFFPDACKRAWNDGFYSSRRYNLRPGIDNPYPVFRG